MSDREYDSVMTCDSCATGDVPVRLVGDAYICRKCDDDIAARHVGVSQDIARQVIDTYMANAEQLAREEAEGGGTDADALVTKEDTDG